MGEEKMKLKKIKRNELQSKLHASLEYPLTIICAPMGYGKTMSILDFIDQHSFPTLCLSIEGEESSEKYIWDTFCRQIKGKDKDLSQELKTIGFPKTTPQRNGVMDLIMKEIGEETHILIIDDYHLNKSVELDLFLMYMIKQRMPNLKIFLLTRHALNIGVEELALKGLCTKIDKEDYHLSLREAATLFKMNRVLAPPEIIERAFELSEGWISALYLLMEHYKNGGSLEEGHEIEKLIGNAIIPCYLPIELEVMTSISVLDHFTLQQVEEITDIQGIGEIVQRVIANSFIRYNPVEKTYTMHNMLRDYFIKHYASHMPANQYTELYQKAGLWFQEKGYMVEAIRCFMKIKAYKRVVEAFMNPKIAQLFYYYPQLPHEIFKAIPFEVKVACPLGYLSYLHYLITTKESERGKVLITELRNAIKQDHGMSSDMKKMLMGEIQHVGSLGEFNDVEKLLEGQERAYNLLGGESQLPKKKKVPTMGTYSLLYLYHREPGTLKKVAETIFSKYRYYRYISGGVGDGLENVAMAEYFFHIGKREEAKLYGLKALERAKVAPYLDIIVCAHFVLARLALLAGDVERAIKTVDQINEYKDFEATTFYYTSIYKPYILSKDWIYLATGDLKSVSSVVRHEALDKNALFNQSIGINYIVYGKLLILEKRYLESTIHCEEMLMVFERYQNILGYIHGYLQMAIGFRHLGKIEKAKKHLQKAINLGIKDGIVTLFVEYGQELLDVLDLQSRDTDYERKLYEQGKNYIEHIAVSEKKSEYIKLTKREEEVLELLVKGYRNKEIAKELFISESAVKKMLTASYRKLGVSNRTMAIKAYNGPSKK